MRRRTPPPPSTTPPVPRDPPMLSSCSYPARDPASPGLRDTWPGPPQPDGFSSCCGEHGVLLKDSTGELLCHSLTLRVQSSHGREHGRRRSGTDPVTGAGPSCEVVYLFLFLVSSEDDPVTRRAADGELLFSSRHWALGGGGGGGGGGVGGPGLAWWRRM